MCNPVIWPSETVYSLKEGVLCEERHVQCHSWMQFIVVHQAALLKVFYALLQCTPRINKKLQCVKCAREVTCYQLNTSLRCTLSCLVCNICFGSRIWTTQVDVQPKLTTSSSLIDNIQTHEAHALQMCRQVTPHTHIHPTHLHHYTLRQICIFKMAHRP